MTTKEKLHHLVEALSDSELPAALTLLESLRNRKTDPVLLALLNAPEDDESETPEEAAAVKEAREDLAAGRVVSHAEARRRLLGAS